MANTLKVLRQFSEDWVDRIKAAVIGWERQFDSRPQRKRTLAGDDAGGCDTQSAIWDIALLGNPAGGTFILAVLVDGVTANITFNYNESASGFKTKLATHSKINAADLTVTGSLPSATMRVQFGEDLAGMDILTPTANWGLLTGGAGLGIICQLAQKGHS